MNKLTVLWSVLAFGLSGRAHALEIRDHFTTVLPMGMGGAFTAVSNDENAIWTNPAGISRVRKQRARHAVNKVKFPNLVGGVNPGAKAFYGAMSSSVDEGELATKISQNSAQLVDKPFWVMAGAAPLMMLNFGRQLSTALAGYSYTTMKAQVDSVNPNLTTTEIISDVGGVAGFALTNSSNRFNLGFQVRPISRYAFEDTLATSTFLDAKLMQETLKTNANVSQGLAIDGGMMFTLADFWFPTIALAVINAPSGCKDNYLNPFSMTRETVCGTVFTGKFSNPDAISTVDPTDFRVGMSITPRFGRKLAMRLAADLHQITLTSGTSTYGLSDIPLMKRVHAGIQIITGNPLLPSPFSISGGISQGYVTAGASLRLGWLSFDVATFGRDISSTGVPYEDRRSVAGFSLDF